MACKHVIVMTVVLMFIFINPNNSAPIRILQTQILLQSVSSNIAVIFYGISQTQIYKNFTQVANSYLLPSSLQFFFVPSDKLQLPTHDPTLFIFFKIAGGETVVHQQDYSIEVMISWINRTCVDPLHQLTEDEIDSYFVNKIPGFIVLDFGQSSIIRAKIILHELCNEHYLKCGKITLANLHLSIIIQIFGVENEPGVPKVGFWNPVTQRIELYNDELFKLTRQNALEMMRRGMAIEPQKKSQQL